MERDYNRDNEKAKRAIGREEEFLRKDVIGKGADTATVDDQENSKTDIEKAIEDR